MKKWLGIFSDKLNITGGFLSGLSILVIGLIVSYEVFVRYLFNAPTTWVLEISIYLCIACVFLAGGYALKEKQHIYVDVITNKLSERNQILFQIVSLVISLVYTLILTWKGAGMAYHSFIMHEVSPTVLNVPVVIPHAAVPIGGFMLVIEFIRQIWEGIDNFRNLKVDPGAKKNPLLENLPVILFVAALVLCGFLFHTREWAPLGILVLLFVLLFCGVPVAFGLGMIGL